MLNPSDDANRSQLIGGIVASMLAKNGCAPVEPHENLRFAGLSSLDIVTLMLAVEDTFELTFPQDKMTPENFRSIQSIEALVADLV
jgi:acyl carrier protein